MHLFDAIMNRRSVGKLTTPAPSDEELEQLMQLVFAAPDHKMLKPYRFVVLTGEQKDQLGQVLLRAALEKSAQTGEVLDEIQSTKILQQPNRAPMIVAVLTNYQEHPKVPEFEQLLTVGAATQNFLLGLTAMGYQSVWRTGLLCNERAVLEFFGLTPPNLVAALVYVGSSDAVLPPRQTTPVAPYLTKKV